MVLKRIDTVRQMIQWIDIFFLILVVLYLMCQYAAIHYGAYWHIHHFRIAFCLCFWSMQHLSMSFKVVRWSAILKGVNNLFYVFFRSIVKCMPDDCVSMKLWVAYRSCFLNHFCYIALLIEHSAEVSTNDP